MRPQVEVFSKSDFEAALPIHNTTGAPLWKYAGLNKGEHTYLVTPFTGRLSAYSIFVRSSVKATGQSAESGKDSIRCWIVRPEGKQCPCWGSKIGRWTTRLPGWQTRLTEVLRHLADNIRLIQPCPVCGTDVKVFIRHADDALFTKCCNETCDLNRPKAPAPPGPACRTCGNATVTRTAGLASKNPGKRFYACPNKCPGWIGWAE